MAQGPAPITRWPGLVRFLEAPPPALAPSFQYLRSRFWLLFVVLVTCAIYVYFASAGGLKHWPVYGDYLDWQAEAFRAGHLYLGIKPAPELLRAADPYDKVNIRYWALDLSYYQGKYYCYWGPVPALFQALGKTLLRVRGNIGDCYIGLVSACLTAWSGALLIERMGRRMFGAVPRIVLIFSVLAFGFANPMLHNVTTAGTYQSAILAGQAFLLPGVLLAFDAVWYAGTSSAKNDRLLLAGVCWGLAIGSRVTVIPTVACLIGVTALAEGWVSARRWHRIFFDALWLGTPVAIVGVGLLVYNQLRFGNPLEFGLNLQLSGYPRLEHFEAQYALPNLYSYSLRQFVTSCQFPYLYQVWWIATADAFPASFPLPRSYYIMHEPVIGFLIAVPISWCIVLAFGLVPRPVNPWHRHTRVYLWCLVSFGALATLTGLTALGIYATTMRYLSDVTPGLVLLALLGAFAFRTHRIGLRIPKLTSSAIILLASATVVMGCALGYQGYAGHFHKYNPELDEKLVKALSFCRGADPKVPHFWP